MDQMPEHAVYFFLNKVIGFSFISQMVAKSIGTYSGFECFYNDTEKEFAEVTLCSSVALHNYNSLIPMHPYSAATRAQKPED